MRRSSQFNNSKYESFVSKIFSSQKFFTFMAVLLLIFIIIPLSKNYKKRSVINKEIEEVKVEIEKFKTDKTDLTDMLDYLKSDASIEEKARLNLGFKKVGEEVVVIKDETRILNNMFEEETEPEKESSNLLKWFQYFFK